MSPLRMGVVGCGAIAQIMHIPYIVEYDERFELIALADAHRPTLDAVGDHYHVEQRYSGWRDLLADANIDAVVLCHNGSHHNAVIAALDANKHVLVEKPLAWNMREVEEVAAHAANSDRVVQLGYHKLYDPAFGFARDHVRQMKDLQYGRISVFHASNSLNLSPYRIRRGNGVINEGPPDLPDWEGYIANSLRGSAGGDLAALVDEALGKRKGDQRLRLGFGNLTGSLIHHIYTLFGFLGEPEKVLHADIWREGMSIQALIGYPDGLRVTLDWHYVPYLNDYREEYAFYGNTERVILQFPGPYYRNFPSPVILQGGVGEQSWEKRVTVSYEEAFRNELLAFYDNVQNTKTPISSVQDAVKHARFIQNLIEAVP